MRFPPTALIGRHQALARRSTSSTAAPRASASCGASPAAARSTSTKASSAGDSIFHRNDARHRLARRTRAGYLPGGGGRAAPARRRCPVSSPQRHRGGRAQDQRHRRVLRRRHADLPGHGTGRHGPGRDGRSPARTARQAREAAARLGRAARRDAARTARAAPHPACPQSSARCSRHSPSGSGCSGAARRSPPSEELAARQPTTRKSARTSSWPRWTTRRTTLIFFPEPTPAPGGTVTTYVRLEGPARKRIGDGADHRGLLRRAAAHRPRPGGGAARRIRRGCRRRHRPLLRRAQPERHHRLAGGFPRLDRGGAGRGRAGGMKTLSVAAAHLGRVPRTDRGPPRGPAHPLPVFAALRDRRAGSGAANRCRTGWCCWAADPGAAPAAATCRRSTRRSRSPGPRWTGDCRWSASGWAHRYCRWRPADP